MDFAWSKVLLSSCNDGFCLEQSAIVFVPLQMTTITHNYCAFIMQIKRASHYPQLCTEGFCQEQSFALHGLANDN